VGDLCKKATHTRDTSSYPEALERGLRRKRPLNAAIVEMNACGVSTRKVLHIIEELCGDEVLSSTVSRRAAQLDQEHEPWRNRAIRDMSCLIIDARYEKTRRNRVVIMEIFLTGW